MKATLFAISAGLLLVLSLACSKEPVVPPSPQPRAFPTSYTIHIGRVHGKCFIDIKGLNIVLGAAVVQWVSDDSEIYTVDFEAKPNLPNPAPGTPFDDTQGKPKHKITTHDSAQRASRGGDYLYSVFDSSSTQCIPATDPGVYVK